MKMFLISMLLFIEFTQAQTQPGSNKIEMQPGKYVPTTWFVDIYQELEKNFPTVASNRVYYVDASRHLVITDKQDKKFRDLKSSTNAVSVKSPDAKSAKRYEPGFHIGIPGDKIEIAFNQKLKVYVQSAKKFVWVIPQATGVRLEEMEATPRDLARLRKVQQGPAREIFSSQAFKTVPQNVSPAPKVGVGN